MTDDRYFQFPLFLLRDLFIDKYTALNSIIQYGLYSFSVRVHPSMNDVTKQLMYCYYRKKSDLPKDLLKKVQSYVDNGELDLNGDYEGFGDEGFNPEVEIEQLLEIFNFDINFKDKAIEFYKIRQAFIYLGIKGNIEKSLEIGKKIHDKIPKGEPMPMINKTQLFDFRDNEKSEFDLMLFAVNIGIRSIIGQNTNRFTNKKMILSRAFGYKSTKCLPETMPELFSKYSQRHHIDRVLRKLELGNWNLITYSHNMRGMYIGLKNKISLENLIEIAESSRTKNKIEDLKVAKSALREKAIIKIQLKRTQC